MDSKELLSDIVVYSKYSRYIPSLKRRETWEEIAQRTADMHAKKYPHLSEEIYSTFANYVIPKKVFPSMRSLQFAGPAIEKSPSRIFNCSYGPVDHLDFFAEAMFLLLGGTGLGASVQQHHIDKLPDLIGANPKKTRRFLVADNIEGWAEAIKVLIYSYFKGKSTVRFDFSDIRHKGAYLVTAGGRAPGPQPLKDAIHNISKVLDSAIEDRGQGTRIKPIEAFDIICHIADAVLAGGIRRAAIITLFSADDHEMLASKSGAWWESNPQRGRSNNSVVFMRHKLDYGTFNSAWEYTKASGAGEPGVILSNDKDFGINPCAEISLRPNSFCNLTTMDVSDVASQDDLNGRVRAAAFIGTLQAGYTDFHYLRPIWKRHTEEDSLLGVSMTGIASGEVLKYDLKEAARVSVETNEEIANLIGIKPAKRVTAIKPEGTSALVAGTSSGVHAYFAPYYIRRMRINKSEALYKYLKEKVSSALLEDEFFNPDTTAVLQMPIKSPDGSIFRSESPIDLLERMKRFQLEWVAGGHKSGANKNNVSLTVSVKDDEWDIVRDWMWENRECYTGISVLPYDGGTYPQLPFEDTDEETYNKMLAELEHVKIDMRDIIEDIDTTDHGGESACAGGNCTVEAV